MNCPHCDSSLTVTDTSGNPWYCCGSTKTFRSMSCLDREPLATKLRAATERIKQLENSRTVAAANSLANMLSYEDAITKIKRLEEQNYTMRARLYPTRPRIPIEKKLAIADAPQNISISELARQFDVSYGTVARYRRQIKAKEAKL